MAPTQTLPPDDHWRVWGVVGGRRSGKTTAILYGVFDYIARQEASVPLLKVILVAHDPQNASRMAETMFDVFKSTSYFEKWDLKYSESTRKFQVINEKNVPIATVAVVTPDFLSTRNAQQGDVVFYDALDMDYVPARDQISRALHVLRDLTTHKGKVVVAAPRQSEFKQVFEGLNSADPFEYRFSDLTG